MSLKTILKGKKTTDERKFSCDDFGSHLETAFLGKILARWEGGEGVGCNAACNSACNAACNAALFIVLFLFNLVHFILMLPFLASLRAGGRTHARANPMEADSNK